MNIKPLVKQTIEKFSKSASVTLNIPILPLTIICTLILFKLFLTSGQSLYAISHAGHDDRLFLLLAQNLINGDWLGEYNNLTLAKGMFYPLWIAVSFISGIPLLLSEQILYILSCLVFILAIRPLIKNVWSLLLIFAFMLFSPISYIYIFTRVIREGIYISITLIVISSAIGLLLRRHSFRKSILWSIFLGISLSTFWLTREEGIWILPFLSILLGYFAIEVIFKYRKLNFILIKNLFPILLPFIILWSALSFISLINYRYYGTYSYVEFSSNSFVNAYGALTRVNHRNRKSRIPVPKETRMRIYSVSPTFKKLEPFLEGGIGDSWAESSNSKEIQGGWFMWALRDSVAAAGYYNDGSTAEKYYQKLSDEINNACDEGILDCLPHRRNTMTPPLYKDYLEPLIKASIESVLSLIKKPGFSPYTDPSSGNSELLILFQDITRENINPLDRNLSPLNNQTMVDGYKLQILSYIGKFYAEILIPLLLLPSLFASIIVVYKSTYKKEKEYILGLVILLGLLAIFTTRIVLISLIHITSFGAIKWLYLSPAYIVILAFLAISIGLSVETYLRKSLN